MKKFIFILGCLLSFNTYAAESDIEDVNKTAKNIASKRTNINTTINLDGEVSDDDLSKEALEFTKKLENCDEYEGEFKSLEQLPATKKQILGLKDDKCETKETLFEGTVITCTFPKDKLSEISKYYKRIYSKSFNGTYNVDFKMKMPEINFTDLSLDNLDFNFKMEMPKLKIDKVKTDVETLIEESCK